MWFITSELLEAAGEEAGLGLHFSHIAPPARTMGKEQARGGGQQKRESKRHRREDDIAEDGIAEPGSNNSNNFRTSTTYDSYN